METKYIAVIDTETNWNDNIMSIGIAVAEKEKWQLVSAKYYIITPECKKGGMFSAVLETDKVKADIKDSRRNVIKDISEYLTSYNIDSIFAYNAKFDYSHLPELSDYHWFDIMRIAAYRQYNKSISENAECFKTGRLKKNYGVEPILRLLSGNICYSEVHNALCDAVDELKIMQYLKLDYNTYKCAAIN